MGVHLEVCWVDIGVGGVATGACVVNDSLASCHLLSAAAAVKYFTCLIAGHLLGGNFLL